MARLLVLFMIFALVTTQGASMAAALCRHGNVEGHIDARQSHDLEAANGSLREEAAAAAAAKKTSPSADPSSRWPAQILPADGAAAPTRIVERPGVRPDLQDALPSRTILPLLEPPSA